LRRVSTRFLLSASALLLASGLPGRQSPKATQAPQQRRVNELKLADLRPGKDTVSRAIRLYKEPDSHLSHPNSPSWFASGSCERMILDADSHGRIETVRIAPEVYNGMHNCTMLQPDRGWKTGLGIGLGSSCGDVVRIYGKPDSRSPSTKAGKPLELLYYAFDWAGPDVPQVMEVVCTPEKDGKPGRVVEITLAAASL
jgi:hypothetical protein